MRRMSLVMLVLGLAACGGCRRAQQLQPQDRESPLTLFEDPQTHECRIEGADVVRGFRQDRINWRVSNHCSADHSVGIVFTEVPGADNELEHNVAKNDRYVLHVKLDHQPGTYKYSLQVDHTTQIDPRLEIDP